jgi:hypothetical protein
MCTMFKVQVCVGAEGDGHINMPATLTVVLVTSSTNIEILLQ